MVLVFGFWPGDANSRDGIIFRDVVRAWPDKDQAERYGANRGAILRRPSTDGPSDIAPMCVPY